MAPENLSLNISIPCSQTVFLSEHVDQAVKTTGNTALHIALRNNAPIAIVSALLAHNADRDLPTKDGSTSRDFALNSDNEEIKGLFSVQGFRPK